MRILALDVGKLRIGIAVSDPLAITARPHSTIVRNRQSVSRIAALAKELEASMILIGLPLHLSGEEGTQAKDVRAFGDKLQRRIEPIPIEFWDERLSSVEATERLSEQKGDWRKKKNRLDAVAAAVILESYLKERESSS
jgi:putative Holliday junction resolvase